MITSFELLLCACLAFLSSFLSASEVAIFSLSRFQLRYLKENFRVIYVKIKKLLADPSGLLVTILVANEVINVSLTTVIEKIVLRNWADEGPAMFDWLPHSWVEQCPDWLLQLGLGIAITTPIVLILCEVTPKALAARANQIIAPLTSPTLLWLHSALKPLRMFISWLIALLLGKRFRRRTDAGRAGEPLLKEDEFLFMVEEGHKEGLVHSSELELIRNIFELDDTKIEEICTPISKIHSVPVKMTIKQALDSYRIKSFSRIPVVGRDKSDVIGILFAKDLIPARLDPALQSATIEGVMHKPLFIRQGTRLNALFRAMRQNQTHMAVIVNAAERAIGLVTMNDLFMEIFGEHFEGGPKPRAAAAPAKERL